MGKKTFLNIPARYVLISHQITLQIFLFIHFRSTIVTLHPCLLCLSLTSLRTSLSKISISLYLRQFQRLCFYFTVILDSFFLSKRSPWLNKLKILYIHISDILDPNRSFRVKRTTAPTTVILLVFIMASLEVSRDLEQLRLQRRHDFII